MTRGSWGTVGVIAAMVLAFGMLRYYLAAETLRAEFGARPSPASVAADHHPTPAAPEFLLSEGDRTGIWEIEQAALVLDRKIFPEMARSIREDDTTTLLDRLDSSFTGRVFAPEDERDVDTGCAQWRESRGDAEPSRVLGKAEFVDYLRAQRGQFASPQAQWRVMRLSPEDRESLGGPWRGSFELRLWGEAGQGGPAEWVVHGRFRSASSPQESSGWTLGACELTDSSFRRAHQFLTEEVAVASGLGAVPLRDNWLRPAQAPQLITGGAYVWDYNGDNHLDVLITDLRRLVLYEGDGAGRFRDVTLARGLPRSLPYAGAEPGIADLDGDGFEDLLVGTQPFRNLAGQGFRSMAGVAELPLPEDAAGFAVADYDRDGRVDLYVTRIAEGFAKRRLSYFENRVAAGNQLWRNEGSWRFRDVTEETGSSGEGRSCYAACWLDANDDAWPDLFLSDEFGDPLLLVGGSSGRFEPVRLAEHFAGFCMGAAAGDLDRDGMIDLYLANMYSKAGDRIISNVPSAAYDPEVFDKINRFVSGSELWRNRGDRSFEPTGKAPAVHAVGWAYGPCLVDLDNDGGLDIYATAGFQSVRRDEPDG